MTTIEMLNDAQNNVTATYKVINTKNFEGIKYNITKGFFREDGDSLFTLDGLTRVINGCSWEIEDPVKKMTINEVCDLVLNTFGYKIEIIKEE